MSITPDTLTRPTLTERQLQDVVIECARVLGWLVYHTHDSRHSPAGFPDLTMCRTRAGETPRLLWAELKTERGRLTAAQVEWLTHLERVSACAAMLGQPVLVEVHIWRPQHWFDGTIERALRS